LNTRGMSFLRRQPHPLFCWDRTYICLLEFFRPYSSNPKLVSIKSNNRSNGLFKIPTLFINNYSLPLIL
jgi:hypothetical protein